MARFTCGVWLKIKMHKNSLSTLAGVILLLNVLLKLLAKNISICCSRKIYIVNEAERLYFFAFLKKVLRYLLTLVY